MSPLDARAQQVIADGEAAWLKVASGNWEESAWRIMGTALLLLRQDVLFELERKKHNVAGGASYKVARGAEYNAAFARRLDGTAFKSMDPSTRSQLLFCMEPANRIVLDRLMGEWTPDERARRTHPVTLAKAIRAALRPPPPPRPQEAPSARPPAGELAQGKARIAELEAELYATLSMTAQQKAEAYIRRRANELAAAFNQAVSDKAHKHLEEVLLPAWKKKIDEAQQIYNRRKGFMRKDTFNAIRRALHPDSRSSISDKKLAEAFDAFMRLEKHLLDEKDSPTRFEYPDGGGWPTTAAEWEARRSKVKAERAAKRAASNAVKPR